MEQEIKEELVNLENRYWQAIKNKDVNSAMALTDFPCIVSGSQGIGSIDREKYAQIMKGAKYDLKEFAIEDAEVRMLNEDVAILAYKVHEELTVDGKDLTIEASDASTWVRRNGKWLCALHTESLHGDPYGRDRNRAV
jgi:hypothetical protein